MLEDVTCVNHLLLMALMWRKGSKLFPLYFDGFDWQFVEKLDICMWGKCFRDHQICRL